MLLNKVSTGQTTAKTFDFNNNAHYQELKTWCRIHWSNTIKKSMDNFNPAIFHDCCFSFSRRAFAKSAGHPVLESVSVMKMPTLKSLSSADEFYKWVVDRMKSMV